MSTNVYLKTKQKIKKAIKDGRTVNLKRENDIDISLSWDNKKMVLTSIMRTTLGDTKRIIDFKEADSLIKEHLEVLAKESERQRLEHLAKKEEEAKKLAEQQAKEEEANAWFAL